MHRAIQVTATFAGLAGVLATAGCAVVPPSGPTVMALPGQGKSFPVFQQDDYSCRGYAQQQTGYQQPGQAATNAAVGSAVLGTAIGAAAGAAIGAAAGNPGAGAAIGGATGLLGGSAIGANNAGAIQASLQQRYDVAYTQCMYARGDTVQAPPPAYASYPAYGYPGYGYPGYAYPYYAPGFTDRASFSVSGVDGAAAGDGGVAGAAAGAADGTAGEPSGYSIAGIADTSLRIAAAVAPVEYGSLHQCRLRA